MDRKPKDAPFAVGQKVRYVGTHRWYADAEGKVPIMAPGMEAVVVEVRAGRRGTNRVLEIDEFSGDEIRDRTTDGYNVYRTAQGQGRIIWPRTAHEWEAL